MITMTNIYAPGEREEQCITITDGITDADKVQT
jgi:hypothetical protein